MVENIYKNKVIKTKFDNLEKLQKDVTPKLLNLFNKKLPDILDVLPPGALTTVFSEKDSNDYLEKWLETSEYLKFLDNLIENYILINNLDFKNYNIIDMWTNKYPPGTFIKHHQHIVYENAVVISLYLICPENSGSLFVSFPEEGPEEYEVITKEGDVVIFPSAAMHWTTPNYSDKDRIVIITEISFGDQIVLKSSYSKV